MRARLFARRLAARFALLFATVMTFVAWQTPAAPRELPFASATLFFDHATGGVSVIGANNVSLEIIPADYQDLDVSRAFHIICHLPQNGGLRRIGVWAARPSHLIPSDVVDYHTFDPTYVELDIDESYFENRDDNLTFKDHQIHIDFFATP